jgi:hypothetical protein
MRDLKGTIPVVGFEHFPGDIVVFYRRSVDDGVDGILNPSVRMSASVFTDQQRRPAVYGGRSTDDNFVIMRPLDAECVNVVAKLAGQSVEEIEQGLVICGSFGKLEIAFRESALLSNHANSI